MRLLTLIRNLFILNIFLLCSIAKAEPMLNGISSHQELGKEQFIGALFSETISNNADTLLAASQPMRIEMKILSEDGMSPRRFSRMWIDGMAINNNPNVLTEQANNIVKLDSLFKGRLLKGDHVVFKLSPGKGVDVSINGSALGTIGDDKFFSLLLSSWIGKVPLSSEFKDNMLKVGDVGSSLRGRFDQIQPSAQRATDLASWSGASVASSAKSSARSSASNIDVDAIESSKPSITLPPISGIEEASSSAISSKATKSVAAASSAPAVVKDDDEDSAPAFTAQTLLARQFYVKEAMKLINKRVRYPATAQQKGQEGSVRVTVTLDRQGNIINIVASETSRYSALTREALAAIERAAPFPALPAEISGNTLEFTAPIRFTLMQQKPNK